ncbi:MAG: AGE family epimerase/isomerase [Clostridia bacterium]|nr:AGE family epimerase/isomerase [Clostridia bacterium]
MDKQLIKSYQNYYRSRLLDDCIPFWMKSDLLDRKYGGYMTNVDREGKVYNEDKSGWFQGRCLWTFSALCNNYGKRPEWVDAAELGVKFLNEKCIDTDGRMFFTLTRDGRPLRKRRYMFSESFYVLSMAEYGLMTGDKEALKKAEDCFEMMLRLYRDPSSDPYKITPKTYASTRAERASAVPMVLVSSAQLLRRCDPEKAEYYTAVTREMVDSIIKYHYKPDRHCVLETVGANGEFINTPAGRCINPGHSMENSWFLMSEAVYSNDKDLLEKALNILNWSLEWGWDKQYGGFIYFTDCDGRPPEQLEHDMKLWWVHDEALIATLYAYGITGEQKYFDWFKKVHDFAFGHFTDHEYGEWYGYLHRDNTVSHTQKGSMWKGPFHYPRMLMLMDKLLGMIADGKPMEPIL